MTRRRTYPKWLVRGLALFALGMTIFAAVVSREHHSTANARDAAQSQLVALEARGLQSTDPSLAMQLALISYRLSRTIQARSALTDVTAGEMPTRLLGRPGHTMLAVGDDDHRVAIAHQANGRVQIYSLHYAQLTLLATLRAGARSARLDAVAMSRNGRLLATGDSRGHVELWSLSSPAHPTQLANLRAGSGAVHGIAFSPLGATLAAADTNGSVQRWSLADPAHPALARPLVAPGRPALQAVSYSRSGGTLTAVGRQGAIVLWHARAAGRPLAFALAPVTLTAVAYSPDDKRLAVGRKDGTTDVWNLTADGNLKPGPVSLTGAGSVTSLAFSKNGRYLAVGTADRAARIWSIADWREVGSLPHPAGVTGVAFTDGDRRLVSVDMAGTTLLWQFPPAGSYRFESAVTGLTYSTTGPRLAVSTQSGQTDQWDVVDEWFPAPVGSWYATPVSAAPPNAYWIKLAAIAATTTTSSGTTTSANGLPVFNPHAGDRALSETRAQTHVLSSALSASGVLFAAAGSDHLVWLWDVTHPAAPKLIAKLSGFTRWATSVVFSGNSQTLFAASDDHTIRMWNVGTPDQPQELANSPLTGPSSSITQLALSPDSRTLAAATTDGHVWVWAAGTPTKADLRATLTAARGSLTTLTFSPSDSTLVAGGSDRRLTFWHYRPYQAANRVCALEGTPITPNEWKQYVPGRSYAPPCAKWTPPVITTTVTTAAH